MPASTSYRRRGPEEELLSKLLSTNVISAGAQTHLTDLSPGAQDSKGRKEHDFLLQLP